jgi:hypothetical protein
MWPSKWISDSKKVAALIAKWRGGKVQVWGYSVSHSQLLIRIYSEREPVDTFSLYLYFKGCNRVEFESSWRGADFEVKQVEGKHGPETEVRDSDHFFVRCTGGPFAHENEEFLNLEGLGT